MEGEDVAALLLRVIVGITLFAHGFQHVWRGGRLAGTGRWFESIGLRPGRVHAPLAPFSELVGGAMLVLGLLTPLAAAVGVGTMLVALVANHLKNGFFIFRPGDGYEYVLMIIMVSVAIGALGGREWSVDRALGIDDELRDGVGVLLALLGAVGAAILLAVSWRPGRTPTPSSPG